MKKYCINHSFSDAHWYCKKCKTYYCFSCVKKKNFKFSKEEAVMHVCPSCKRTVQWVGIEAISDNVFVSTTKALNFPRSSLSMLVIAFMTCLGMLFTKNIFINEALFVLIWGLTASYANDVLDRTIKGENEPPHFMNIPLNKLTGHILSVFKQSMIYLVAAVLYFATSQMNNSLFSLCVLGLFSIIFPLGLMKNITTRKFKSFFDLANIGNIFKRNGAQYIVLAALFAPVLATFHLYVLYDPRLVTPVICYLLIVIYRLLGQMILKSHLELNYSLNYEDFKDKYSLETLHGFKA